MTKQVQNGSEIATVTSLMARVNDLMLYDPDGYRELMSWDGTPKLLPGARIHADSSFDSFIVRPLNNYDIYCQILPIVAPDGKLYSKYVPQFMVTRYQRRLHQYLPFGFAKNEKPSSKHAATVTAFNVDGSVAASGWWQHHKRCSGAMHLVKEVNGRRETVYGPMCIRDSDGKFCMGGELDQSTLWQARSVPMEYLFGKPCGSVDMASFYDSMLTGNGLWDADKVRKAAVVAHKEAIELTKQDPRLKIALFPMEKVKRGDIRRCLDSPRMTHVLHRDEQGVGIYRLPEVCVYRAYFRKDQRGWARKKTSVIIPPHGNSLLKGEMPLPKWPREATEEPRSNETVAQTLNVFLGDKRIDWGDYSDSVLVCSDGDTNAVARPENAFNHLKEQALMSCLPLC